MKKNRRRRQQGFTLLELGVTLAMLAVLATSSVALVRTSYVAWQRHDFDHGKRQSATALIRHIQRQTRQAKAVQDISPFLDPSGSLSLLMNNGEVAVWDHDATSKEVRFGIGAATDVLATGIEELRFYGYKTNMVLTGEPGLIHTVAATTRIQLERPAGITSESWLGSAQLRSW